MKLTKQRLKEIIREEIQTLNESKKISKSYGVDYVGNNGFFIVDLKRKDRLYIDRTDLANIIKAFKKF